MPTLKQYLKPKPQIRKCPYCKSIKGFEANYSIEGNGTFIVDFKGFILHSERETFDKFGPFVNCSNCGKSIDIESVEHLL